MIAESIRPGREYERKKSVKKWVHALCKCKGELKLRNYHLKGEIKALKLRIRRLKNLKTTHTRQNISKKNNSKKKAAEPNSNSIKISPVTHVAKLQKSYRADKQNCMDQKSERDWVTRLLKTDSRLQALENLSDLA